MKNLFTNLMKNTAKRTQNTGGGASRHEALIIAEQFSQCQTSRSEGARQITARFESAQMKNTSLISGCSAVDVPMPSYGASDEHPMSTRSASDGGRWNSRGWKYVACMLMVLVMSIGQMWGAIGSATSVFTCGTTSTGLTYSYNFNFNSANSDTILFSLYDLYGSSATYAGQSGGPGSGSANVSTIIYNEITGENKAFNSSPGIYGANSVRRVTSGKYIDIYVTNCIGVICSGEDNTPLIQAYEYTGTPGKGTMATEPAKTGSTTATSVTKFSISGLTASKTYCIRLIGSNSSNASIYEVGLEYPHASGGGGDCTSHSVNLSGSGSVTGGTFTTSSATVCEEATATLTATPAAGYEFTSWSATGTGGHSLSSTTTNPATLTMGTADVTVNATFSQIDYTVSETLTNCAVKAGSSAIPSTMHYGDDLSTIIEPTTGNLLPGSITVSGVTSYTWNALTGALTLTDVTGNVSITVAAAAPQTGTGTTVTYSLVTSGSTAATYSTGVFTGILSDGTANKNTIVASKVLSGGNGVAVQSDKNTPKKSRTAGITSSTADFNAASSPYAEFTFNVVDGYTFTPTAIGVPVLAITYNAYFTAIVTDGSSTWTSATSECTQGEQATINATPSGGSALTGTVHIRVFCHNQETDAKGFRFGEEDVTITGTVAAAPSSGYTITNGSPSNGTIDITDGSSAITSAAEGETVYIEATPSTGYSFSSWSVTETVSDNAVTLNDDDDSDGTTRNFDMPGVAVTVNASFSANNYTVTYLDEGGSDFSGTHATGKPTTHTYGAETTLKSASKDNYRFDGWFTNSSCTGDAITSLGATDYTANITLYAKWTQVYSVSITTTNASKSTGASTAAVGENYVATFAAVTGYDLPTSVTVTIGGEAAELTTDYTWSAGTLTVLSASVTGAIAISVTGSAQTYTISYKDEGNETYSGDNLASLPTSHTYGSATDLVDGEKDGYTFEGWYTDASCTVSAGSSIGATAKTADFTLYAKWAKDCPSANSGAVVYKFEVKSKVSDGNICSTQNVAVSLNTTTHLTTLTGGTLEGLVTSSSMNNLAFSSGRIQYANGTAGVLILTLDCAVKTGDIIRFVNYSSSNSKYNYLRHTSNSTTTDQITLNASTTAGTVQEFVVPSAFNNKDVLYIVSGSNTTGISYFEIIRPYVVTLNANTNGGNVGGENTATYYAASGEEIVLPHAFKSGNYFNGWFPNASTGDAVSNPYTPTGSTTLYAQYGDCPEDGTVYKFQVATGLDNGGTGITSLTDLNIGNYLSNLVGGTLEGYASNASYLSIAGNNAFSFENNGTYLKVTLDCALQAGDKFKSTTANKKFVINKTASTSGAFDLTLGADQETDVPADLVGEKTLYIYRSGSNTPSPTISYFEVYRPERFAVTYHKNDGSATTQVNTVSSVEGNMFTRNGYTFVKWHTEADGTSGVDKAVGAAVTAAIDLYAIWECTTPTFGTDLSTTPHVVREGDAAVTLTVAASANSGTVTYQWYSNTSKSTSGATALTTDATYNAPTSSVGTLYYYCVATNTTGGGCTAQSAYATVTVNEAPCFEFKAGTTKAGSGWDVANNGAITTSLWTDGSQVLTGGTLTNTSGSALGCNADYGLVYAANGSKQVTVAITGGKVLSSGSVITIVGYSNNSTDACGFKISGNNMSPATYTPGSATYTKFTQTYTVTGGSALDGSSSFTIDQANSTRVYLNSITVTGCADCTPIDPELSYSKTTIWMDDADLTATPSLDKDGSTGIVSYALTSATPSGCVTLNTTTGVVTAVKRGTATITATIAADGTHCGKSVSSVITVKDITCGYTEVAKLTRTSDSGSKGTISGPLAGNYGVNTQGNGKLGSDGHYMYLVLSSGHYYADGDSVYVTINTINNQGSYLTIRAGGKVPGADLAQLAMASLEVGANNGLRLSNVPANTDTITIYRKDGSDQNHQLDAITVKRYGCPDIVLFDDAKENGKWSDEGNWIGSTGHGATPTIDDRIVINKPMTVDIAHATAAAVILDQSDDNNVKLTIQPNKGLEVAGTITRNTSESTGLATRPEDLILESSSAGNASLIFNNNNECQATVQMYSIASISEDWKWQFMGIPFTTTSALYSYYGSYLYEWNAGGYWDAVANGGTMEAFKGYCITQDAPAMYVMGGTLNPTSSDKEITIPANKEFVMANSWSAPISVCNFTNTTLPLTDKTIYLFNTGHNESGATEGTAAGTYVAMPISSAIYTGNYLIAPMEGFYVDNTDGSEATITLKYDELVRPSGSHTDIVAGPMHAPKRIAATEEPAVMKLKATGSRYSERVVILEREDFSTGFDNGWDGKNLNEPGVAPILYTLREDGTKDAVSAIPTYEGTVVGFRNGEDNFYTFSFEYDGEDNWYLNDLKEQKSTLINAAETYEFVAEPGDTEARFVISATPIHKIATGNESAGAEAAKVRKLIIDDKVYIIRGGRMYSVDGQMIK